MSDWETEERRPRPIAQRTQVDSPDTWTRSSEWPQRFGMSVDRQQHEARHGPWRQSHSPSIQAQRSATSAPKSMAPWRQNHQPTRERVSPNARHCWSKEGSQATSSSSRNEGCLQTTATWRRREPHVQTTTWRHRASLDDSQDAYHAGAFDDESWPRRHPRPCPVKTSWASQRNLDVDSTPTHVLQSATSVEDSLGGNRVEQRPILSVGRERQRHWSDRSSRRLNDVVENDAADKHVLQVRPRVGRMWHGAEVAPIYQPRIASRRRGDWLGNDVQQASSSSSSPAPARVREQVQDSFVTRASPIALAGMRAALTLRDNESDKASHAAAIIKVEGQHAQVQVQAGKQRSFALGKRKVRAGGSSLVDETLVGGKRPCDVVHNNMQNILVGQRDNSVVSR
jgi:hypothetical protein